MRNRWVPQTLIILLLIIIVFRLFRDDGSDTGDPDQTEVARTEVMEKQEDIIYENLSEDIHLEFISVGDCDIIKSYSLLSKNTSGDILCETSTGNLYIMISGQNQSAVCPVYRSDGQTVMNIGDFEKRKEK